MTTTTESRRLTGLLTPSEIAVLAGVQRPVVSMWRRRPHGVAGSFPQPVVDEAGRERFERDEVLAWLAASGRGNNPDVVADAAFVGAPPVPTPAGLALAEALLVLRAEGDALDGCDRDDLLDLAEGLDPDDTFLLAEIDRVAEDDVAAMTAYVESFWQSSFGAGDAWTRLHADLTRWGLPMVTDTPSTATYDLLGRIAAPLGARGEGAVPLVDPTGCCPDVLLAAREVCGDEAGGEGATTFLRPEIDADDARLRAEIRRSWRRMAVHGPMPRPVAVDDEGLVDVTGRSVVVARYPHPGMAASTPGDVLSAIENVLIQLGPGQWAVVLAPAEVLVDALADPGARLLRDDMVRQGRVRALLRLDHGSVPAVRQRRLAVWVAGPTPPERSGRGEYVAVADLAGLDLTEVASDLVSDVVAACEDAVLPRELARNREDDAQARTHRFAVARYRPLETVAARADLVPRDMRTVGRGALAGEVDTDRVADLAHAAGVMVSPAQVPEAGSATTVRVLLDSGRLAAVPGTRLAPGEVRPARAGADVAARVPVIGVPELLGEALPGSREVDLMAFLVSRARPSRTEPGDVVFCTSPRRAAWVDDVGGAVVEFPARVLRVTRAESGPDRVVPHVLAADLERGSGRAWRADVARLVPAAHAPGLAAALRHVAARREAARRRVAELEELHGLLADGVVAGHLTTMMDSTETEGH